MERIQINGENVEFKLDCGADVTSIPERLYKPERDVKLQLLQSKHGSKRAQHLSIHLHSVRTRTCTSK